MNTSRSLLCSLHTARDFEDAAAQVLDAMLAHLGAASGAATTVLRGIVHLRPGGTYAGVLVRGSAPAGTLAGDRATLDIVPSSTAWHWVDSVRGPLVLDVTTGRALGGDGREVVSPQGLRLEFRSREVVLGRYTTHILAVPLRRPGGGLDGFYSLELSAADGVPRWTALAGELQELADVAAPFVRELPRAALARPLADPLLPVVGEAMRPLIEDLHLFAATSANLLLLGETGAGKSQLARWCWARSARRERPFVHVHLAAGNENLREGALFGWVKGAFTGAIEARKGMVAEAEGGTLFIDEIDKLPLSGQATLLSLLDDGEYRVLGDCTVRHADVRFIVGTNADLKAEVEAGRFLRDLYYRIQVVPMQILPLRERRDEIVPWAEFMMRGMHKDRSGEVTLEPAAGALLRAQPWPGNLRQLYSAVFRAYTRAAAVAGDSVHISLAHVQRALAYEDEPGSHDVIAAFERAAEAFVTAALERRAGLSLDHVQALGGFVLRHAIERLNGDVRAACTQLDRARYVDGHNHHKLVKRELGHIDALVQALSGEPSGGS